MIFHRVVCCTGQCYYGTEFGDETDDANARCEVSLDKLPSFDDTDYAVVVKNRAPPPNPWRGEIYRAGRSSPIGQSAAYFRTMAAAGKAGKVALKQLLSKLNT